MLPLWAVVPSEGEGEAEWITSNFDAACRYAFRNGLKVRAATPAERRVWVRERRLRRQMREEAMQNA